MNILAELTKLIKNECDNAIKNDVFGTQEFHFAAGGFHIEKIERLADKEGVLNFRVKVIDWDDVSENWFRQEKEMSLVEIMDLLGRIIAERATTDSVGLFNDNQKTRHKIQ